MKSEVTSVMFYFVGVQRGKKGGVRERVQERDKERMNFQSK